MKDEFKNLAQAEVHCRESIRLSPEYDLAYQNYGRLLMDLNRNEEAEQILLKCISLGPPNPSFPMTNLGIVYNTMRRFKEAEDILRKAVTVEPEDAQAWMNLGSVYHGQGKFQIAYDTFFQAVKLDKYNAEIHKNLAIASYDLKRFEDALMFLQNAYKINPNDRSTVDMMNKVQSLLATIKSKR
jgi:tetratricopeptide (TPR) repeat protein